MMQRRVQLTLRAAVMVLLSGSVALGTSVRTLNLSEMVEYADRVFYGKCVSARSVIDPTSGFSVREYRFRVLEGIKGVGTGEEISVKQLLGTAPGGLAIPGLPQYQKGQELLLFLHGDSRLGLTSPVGMAQGTFRPSRLGTGEMGFVNAHRNRNLTHELRQEKSTVGALSVEELSVLDSGEPIPLVLMREMITKLDRLHKRGGEVVN